MTAIDRLHRRNLMNNGRVMILATDDTGGVHKAQVTPTPGEVIDDVPVVQTYGFSGHAPVGSEAHMVCVRGDRSSPVIVATNNASARMRNLQPGETAIYTDEGDYIVLSRGRITKVVCGTQVEITCPLVTITGDLHVQGEIIRGFGTGDQVTLGKHLHDQPNDSHGDAQPPTSTPVPGT